MREHTFKQRFDAQRELATAGLPEPKTRGSRRSSKTHREARLARCETLGMARGQLDRPTVFWISPLERNMRGTLFADILVRLLARSSSRQMREIGPILARAVPFAHRAATLETGRST
jgi:hypothetical protein